MNTPKIAAVTVAALACGCSFVNATTILFQDDFAGYILDSAKWSVELAYGASVVQNNGSIILNHPLPSKAILTAAVSLDIPFAVESSFTLENHGIFALATRASGEVNPLSYYDPYGLQFVFYDVGPFVPQQRLDLIAFAPGGGYVIDTLPISFDINSENTYTITDKGSSVSIILNGVFLGDFPVDPGFSVGNHVVLSDGGKWDASGAESSTLGPITITAIPEPGSMIAIGCFLASALTIRKRQRAI